MTCRTHHYEYQILYAGKSFLVGGISLVRDFIIKLWEKFTTTQIVINILEKG